MVRDSVCFAPFFSPHNECMENHLFCPVSRTFMIVNILKSNYFSQTAGKLVDISSFDTFVYAMENNREPLLLLKGKFCCNT